MHVIETRFTGRQASASGITRFINRHIGDTPVARVEVRYSTQAAQPLASQALKQSIADLLLEKGMGAAEISVRSHEGGIEDATGEHLLRLYPSSPSAAPAQGSRQQADSGLLAWRLRPFSSVFPRLFAKLFSGWFKAPAARPATSAPATVARPPALPSLSNAQVVALLRQAVVLALDYPQTLAGQAMAPALLQSQSVASALVTVRQQRVHAALAPLITQDAAHAAESLRSMLRSHRIATGPGFSVAYAFKPCVAGDGTSYASDADVEVVLRVADPAQGTGLPAVVPLGTALPESAHAQPKERFVVQVLGTWEGGRLQPFEVPVRIAFAQDAARFDRQALACSAFGKDYPQLLAVASNSCPIHLERSPDGAAQLVCSARSAVQTGALPMYYSLPSLAPMDGRYALAPGPLQMLVNSPLGVRASTQGLTLPALVIEVAAPAA